MPNWVTNRVVVYGAPEELKAFREHAGKPAQFQDEDGGRLSEFSFWNFIKPDDSILDEYWHGSGLEGGLTFEDRRKSSNNWYDWNNRNWGTKWDAGYVDVIESNTDSSIEFRFETAWSPPMPVFEKMVEMFPHLTFSIWYEEEQGWGGELTGLNGELLIDNQYDIPDTHAENMSRREYCYCQDAGEQVYADCPKVKEKV